LASLGFNVVGLQIKLVDIVASNHAKYRF